MYTRSFLGIAAGAGVCLMLGACSGKKFQPQGGPFLMPPGTMTVSNALCPTARSSEPLVPRIDLSGMSASRVGGQDVAYTSDLFGQFYSFCGGCHVDGAQGPPGQPRHIDKNVAAFVAGFDA